MGKTCVVQNFKSGMFTERQQNTIGVDFTVRTLDIEGKKVKVSLSSLGLCGNMCAVVTGMCVSNDLAKQKLMRDYKVRVPNML